MRTKTRAEQSGRFDRCRSAVRQSQYVGAATDSVGSDRVLVGLDRSLVAPHSHRSDPIGCWSDSTEHWLDRTGLDRIRFATNRPDRVLVGPHWVVTRPEPRQSRTPRPNPSTLALVGPHTRRSDRTGVDRTVFISNITPMYRPSGDADRIALTPVGHTLRVSDRTPADRTAPVSVGPHLRGPHACRSDRLSGGGSVRMATRPESGRPRSWWADSSMVGPHINPLESKPLCLCRSYGECVRTRVCLQYSVVCATGSECRSQIVGDDDDQ